MATPEGKPEQFFEAVSNFLFDQSLSHLERAVELGRAGDRDGSRKEKDIADVLDKHAIGIGHIVYDLMGDLRPLGIELQLPALEKLLGREAPTASIEPAAVELTVPPPLEKRSRVDFTPKQEEVADAFIAPNQDRTDWANNDQTIAKTLFADQLNQIEDEKQRQARLNTYKAQLRGMYASIEGKLQAAREHPDQTPEHVAGFILRAQSLYPGIIVDDLIAVFGEDELDFAKLQKRVSKRAASSESEQGVSQQTAGSTWPLRHPEPVAVDDPDKVAGSGDAATELKAYWDAQDRLLEETEPLPTEEEANQLRLTEPETAALAGRLSTVDEAVVQAVGLNLSENDREEAGAVAASFSNNPEAASTDPQETLISLGKKLVAFVGKKTQAFDVNTDPNSFQLLTMLTDLQTEEQIRTILGLPEEAEKKDRHTTAS